MEKLPDLYPVQLHLMVLPRPVRREVTNTTIAHLALRSPVRVLDGGNRFDAYGISRSLRRKTPHLKSALERIQVRRAFTCYQVISLLSEVPLSTLPTLVLDLLTTFYDESVDLPERLRLLKLCLEQLRRLSRHAPVITTTTPRPDQQQDELLEQLEECADQTWRFEMEQPAPVLRLF